MSPAASRSWRRRSPPCAAVGRAAPSLRPMQWRESDGVRWLEAELPGATAAFSARTGGFSDGPFESLNLGVLTDDDEATVRRNRARLCEALGLDPASVLIGRQ